LAQLFPDSQNGSSQDQAASQIGGMPPPPEFQDTGSSGASASTLKKDRLLAVPDPRTSSVLVSAPATRMPLITRLIAELDASPARKEVVKTWELRNADPRDVSQILQDLFNRNSGSRNNNNNNRNSLLGDNNPLTARSTKQQTTSTTSGFGSVGSSGGVGGAGGSEGGGAPGGGGASAGGF
jgi:type II secretory pathway component GspD/PulD (secretin)